MPFAPTSNQSRMVWRLKGISVQKQERMGYMTASLCLTIPKSGAQVAEGDEVVVTMVWASADPAATCIALIADTHANRNVPVQLGAHAALLFTSQACRKFHHPSPRIWYVLTARGEFATYDRNHESLKAITASGWSAGTMDAFIRQAPLVQALWLEYVLLVEQRFSVDVPRLSSIRTILDAQSCSGLMVGQGGTIIDAVGLASVTVTYINHDRTVLGVKRDQVPLVIDTKWGGRLAVYAPTPFGQQELFHLDSRSSWVCSASQSSSQLKVGIRLFGTPQNQFSALQARDAGKSQNIIK